ncbi:hypothetical protein ABPG73_020074 [Tetrahymena malaccensis]
MMGIDFKIFESCLNIVLSGIYLYLAIQQWMHSTQSENRVMVCIFITLLLGFQQSLILFRIVLPNQRRYDFQITIMYLIIHLINCSEIQDLSIFSIDFHLDSQIAFIQYSFIFFYSILLVNLVYYVIIAICLLIVGLISLIQIWHSSDSIVNREGLTSQEFESLPSHIVNAKESQNMKASFESGIHNPQLNDCAICLQTFEEKEVMIEIVQCKHLFHSECIKVWFKNSVLCPYCRNDVRKALQKLKREKHQLQHAGHSILDKIVDQAEPSFQLEEFIEENDLRNQQQNLQNIQQLQQIQDILENQQNGENNQNQINNVAVGRIANPIFQNIQSDPMMQRNDNLNLNPQSFQQSQAPSQNRSQSPEILRIQQNENNIVVQNSNNQQQISQTVRYPQNDDILSNSQSFQYQYNTQQQNQQIFFQPNQHHQLQNQQQQQQQLYNQNNQQQQQQLGQQQRRAPFRIVEPPSLGKNKSQPDKSSTHLRVNSFGSDDDQFYKHLQQQHQNFELQIRNSNESFHSNQNINASPLNYYADGAGYSNSNKKILQDFSFYDEHQIEVKQNENPNNEQQLKIANIN